MLRSLTTRLTFACLATATFPFAGYAQFTNIYSFPSTSAEPVGAPIINSAGVIYGVSYSGSGASSTCATGTDCGTFFKLTKPTTSGAPFTQTTLYQFQGGSDGAAPNANPIYYNTYFYGTTYGGGSGSGGAGQGTVYAMLPVTGGGFTHQVIYKFSGALDGSHPTYLVGFQGKIYGIANYGGTSGSNTSGANTNCCGVVFQLTPPSGSGGGFTEAIVHAFSLATDGAFPQYIASYNGSLYVSLSNGGPSNGGTMVQLTPPASGSGPWTSTVIYSFSSASPAGFNPEGFTFDSHGNIFGVEEVGGGGSCSFFHYSGCGAVYELTNPGAGGGTWGYSQIFAFTGGSTGNAPFAPPVFDSNGNLYVTSTGLSQSAPTGGGAVVELTPSGSAWNPAVLHTFTGADGSDPAGQLTLNPADGNLYGFTIFGGASGDGAAYSVTPATPATFGK